ncbi:MAG: tRNA-specific adenosine deaminase [Bacteroidetes bacterium]|nr:MAG: tRNA-specific adenosine deaminase [Bacteroidota bacterium]
MVTDKQKFMQEAIWLAQENLDKKNGGPFGAVVVKNGKIIGKGVNTVTTNNDPTAHAEVNAIRDACKNIESFQLDDCEIYSSCEPCPMCPGAIYWARPAKLYFAATKDDAASAGFDDSEIYREIALPKENRKIPTEQILQKEARQVFTQWVNMDNKTEY